MECKDITYKFSEYIDNNLSEEELIIFEEHINKCKKCQKELNDFKKMVLDLKNIEDLEPPKNLKSKIMNNIKENSNSKQIKYKTIIFRRYSYAAVLVFAILIGGITLSRLKLDGVNNLEDKNKDLEVASFEENYNNRSIINQNDTNIQDNRIILDNEVSKNLDESINIKSGTFNEEPGKSYFEYEMNIEENTSIKILVNNKSDTDISIHLEDPYKNRIGEIYVIKRDNSDFITFEIKNVHENPVYSVKFQTVDKSKVLKGDWRIEYIKNYN